MARKKGGHTGGHGWFVTFADLMALLMSFFVMLVAFSTQDSAKLHVVAGSMREAFGVQTQARHSGVIELDGLPTRAKLKSVANIPPEQATNTPGPNQNGDTSQFGARNSDDGAFALASASLRQAMQNMPEIADVSKHIMIEETRQGLNIEITDQDGRAMFPDGSKEPYDRMRRVLQRLAGPLKAMPYRMSIAGHTAATRRPQRASYGPWELSADRANTVRRILEEEGVPASHFFMVAGRADTQPLFPDDAFISANRRVTITLMREAPPMPPAFKP
jgi:chemotaxis protein MotB